MRYSELNYIEILKILDLKGQQNIKTLMQKSNLNYETLKEQMDFLKENGLVAEKSLKNDKIVYAITTRGIEILKAFGETIHVSPMEPMVNQEAATPLAN